MSIFNPEKLVHNLIASLGVKPEEFVAFIQLARDEFIGIRNDRQAFRPASAKAYQDIVARLDRLENLMIELKDLQRAWIIALTPEHESLINERNDLNRN